jgi:hypothetical protein
MTEIITSLSLLLPLTWRIGEWVSISIFHMIRAIYPLRVHLRILGIN